MVDSEETRIIIGCVVGAIGLLLIITIAFFVYLVFRGKRRDRLEKNNGQYKRKTIHILNRFKYRRRPKEVQRVNIQPAPKVYNVAPPKQIVRPNSNDIKSVRYFTIGDGKPMSVDYFAKTDSGELTRYITREVINAPSREEDNIEQTIDYPISVIDSSEATEKSKEKRLSNFVIKEPMNAIIIEENLPKIEINPPKEEYSVPVVENPVPVVEKPVPVKEKPVQKIISETSTQTFCVDSQSTQTLPIETIATQTIEEEPTKIETNDVGFQENEVEEEVDYPNYVGWPGWGDYDYNAMYTFMNTNGYVNPYIYPQEPFYYVEEYSSEEEKPKRKKKKKLKSISIQTTIKEPKIPEPKEEKEEKEKEVTKIIEKRIIIVPDERYTKHADRLEREETERKNVLESRREEYINRVLSKFNNDVSLRKYTGRQVRSRGNGGGKKSQQTKSSKTVKQGTAFISEKDLYKIWATRQQKRQVQNGSIKLEIPPEYLRNVRFQDDAQTSIQKSSQKDEPPVDYDKTDNDYTSQVGNDRTNRNYNSVVGYDRTGDEYTSQGHPNGGNYSSTAAYARINRNRFLPIENDRNDREYTSNDASVLQRYLQDVSEHSSQQNSRNQAYASGQRGKDLRTSTESRRTGGFVSHLGSYRPDADTHMHRNQPLRPQVVEILPES